MQAEQPEFGDMRSMVRVMTSTGGAPVKAWHRQHRSGQLTRGRE